MLRETSSYLGSTARAHLGDIAIVAGGGVVAGGAATSKSLLEAAIIQEVADTLADRDTHDVWHRELSRLDPTSDSDLATDLTSRFLPSPTLQDAVLAYLVVTVLAAAVAISTTLSRQRATRTLFQSLYGNALRRAFTRGCTRDEANEPGGLAGAIQQGARSVAGSYAFLIEAVQYLFALGTVVLVLAGVSPAFSIFCMAIALVFALLSWLRGRHLEERRRAFDDRRRHLFAVTDDVLSNRDVLLAHERRDRYVGRLTDSARELGTIDVKLAVREQAYSTTVGTLYDVGRLAILAVVLWAALRGDPVSQVGDAYFYVSVFGRLMSPVQGLLRGYDDMRRSTASSRTLLDLLQHDSVPPSTEGATCGDDTSPTEVGEMTPAVDSPARTLAVQFSGVSFSYGETTVLSGCDFEVPEGGVTLLVGRSGSGKTTAARMMLGFLQPQAGSVRVLGCDVRTWDHDSLLARMSYLAQTGHVVEGTVEENLFASDEATPADMLTALRHAGLHLDGGEDVLTREARTLSEGQKQRLALARILVDRSPIVVLDEPLAGVDAFTFSEVISALAAWLGDTGRTVILISHRLAFASCARHVVVLDEFGGVAEQGPPEDLTERPDGIFRQLVATARQELDGRVAQ